MAGVPRAWAVLLLLVGTLLAARPVAAPSVRLQDLDNKPVDPFQAAGSAATVFVFTSVDCPISNRYAPEVRRLYETFASQGVTFWLIYPNPRESAAQIRKHLKDYAYPVKALRDPGHELVKLAGVAVTPETALFDRKGALAYHGRIDDRYVGIGVERPAPTERDLQVAISAVLAGKPVAVSSQPAAGGCYIADFKP